MTCASSVPTAGVNSARRTSCAPPASLGASYPPDVAPASIDNRRGEIQRLDDPATSVREATGRHLSPGEVEVHRAQNIEVVVADEQTERPADAGVHVEQLVLAVPLVESVADVEDAAVA